MLAALVLPLLTTSVLCEKYHLPWIKSFTVELGSVSYYVPGTPLYRTENTVSISDMLPVTVITTNNTYITNELIFSTIASYEKNDDVYTKEFASNIYIEYTGNAASAHVNISGFNHVFINPPLAHVAAFPSLNLSILIPGPYLFRPSNYFLDVHTLYKLYSDVTQSFMQGIVPNDPFLPGTYVALPAAIAGDNAMTIAVPSKIYSSTSAKPLAGARIAIKDIFSVAGLKTSCGSRAYYALYPVSNVTAFAVQRLIDAGGIIVGQSKTSHFANGEEATGDWIDYHSPFSVRADGYQLPASSSTGSGTSVAAYDWIDYSIGTDTGGSIREPASVLGIYGMRPSHGAISLENVMPFSTELDTAGFFARDPIDFAHFGKVWYGDRFLEFTMYPKEVRVITPVSNMTDAGRIFYTFITNLSRFLNGSVTNQNMSAQWDATSGCNETLDSYFNTTYATIAAYEQLTHFGHNFESEYKMAFNDRFPFEDPPVVSRWGYARTLTKVDFVEALARKQKYKDWYATIQKHHSLTCSDSIGVFPQSLGIPYYRNAYLADSFYRQPFGYSEYCIAEFAGVPNIVIPVGQISYISTVTMNVEYLPVTVSMVAAKGCDYMLLNLVRDLGQAGILRRVQTGVNTFPV